MSMQQDTDEKTAAAAVSEREVGEYLRRHPEFFETHRQLLADLRLPHHVSGAVSLVERQVAVLRDTNAQYKKQLDDLLQIARENDRLNRQLHELTLHLMECSEFDGILALVLSRLRRDFNADMVNLHLLAPPRDPQWQACAEFVQDVDAFRGPFQRLLSGGRPFCGRLKDEQLEALFGAQAPQVGSAAVLPLGRDGNVGLLAIGSCDGRRFQPNVDTAFLLRMAQVVATALAQHLQLDGE
jgi:uncharacterized protein YigA (DUF484 family)